MSKTLQKPIFTEDLDKYFRFLEASNVNLKVSAAAMQSEIKAKEQVCDLIRKYQDEKILSRPDLDAIIVTACPDFVTLSAFEKLNDCMFASVEAALADAENGEPIYDCSSITCETCWKNYINHMARLLNKSFVDVKLYDKGDEPDAD